MDHVRDKYAVFPPLPDTRLGAVRVHLRSLRSVPQARAMVPHRHTYTRIRRRVSDSLHSVDVGDIHDQPRNRLSQLRALPDDLFQHILLHRRVLRFSYRRLEGASQAQPRRSVLLQHGTTARNYLPQAVYQHARDKLFQHHRYPDHILLGGKPRPLL